jgi:hypothetical protein
MAALGQGEELRVSPQHQTFKQTLICVSPRKASSPLENSFRHARRLT